MFLSRSKKSSAEGVVSIFGSAGAVGEADAIAVMGVGKRPNKNRVENPSVDIGRPKKVGRTIEKGKNCAGWD